MFANFHKKIFVCCYNYVQTVKLEFTRRFSFVNLFAFVCELVCIYMWIFETLLTWLDSQMHFFQQGTLCSQSDASLLFSQSHDCSDWVFTLSVPFTTLTAPTNHKTQSKLDGKSVLLNVTQFLLLRH